MDTLDYSFEVGLGYDSCTYYPSTITLILVNIDKELNIDEEMELIDKIGDSLDVFIDNLANKEGDHIFDELQSLTYLVFGLETNNLMKDNLVHSNE